MANRIQLRRGTAAQWASKNPVLGDGEPGIERDTGKQKFGNGVSAWSALPYASAGPQGPAGVADDASVKTLITTPGSQTATALKTTIASARESIDVRNHGASTTASGLVNRTAINAAAAIAEAEGKDLYFGPSSETYVISGSINSRSNVRFHGNATIVADSTMSCAIGEPIGDAENIVIEGLTFVGGVPDDDGLSYPRRTRAGITPSFSSAIRITGDKATDGTVTRKIRNVTVRNVRVIGTQSLPIRLEGIRGHSVINDCDIYNTMDCGYVACDFASFTDNKVERSHDNGVSVSRSTGRAIIANNHFADSAYFGVFCAGWTSETAEGPGGVSNPGPTGFTITGNVIARSGRGGICMQDAPRYGVVVGNTIDTVFRGALDQPHDYDGGHGILISGWPAYPSTGTPNIYADQILISSNLFKNCGRGGVNLRGATNITIDGNMFVDLGEPFLIDGTTSIASTDVSLNNGVYSGTPATVSNLSIRNNDFIDTRATAVMNYAVIPQLVALGTTIIRGNTLRRLRQPLAEVVKADKVVPGDGRFNFAQDLATGALLAERRDAAGVRLSVPLQISASTGEVRTNDLLNIVGGAYLPAGTTLGIDTATGAKIGSSASKIGFFGVTAVAKPALTYSRTGEPAQTAAMRVALASLGLITDSTVA